MSAHIPPAAILDERTRKRVHLWGRIRKLGKIRFMVGCILLFWLITGLILGLGFRLLLPEQNALQLFWAQVGIPVIAQLVFGSGFMAIAAHLLWRRSEQLYLQHSDA